MSPGRTPREVRHLQDTLPPRPSAPAFHITRPIHAPTSRTSNGAPDPCASSGVNSAGGWRRTVVLASAQGGEDGAVGVWRPGRGVAFLTEEHSGNFQKPSFWREYPRSVRLWRTLWRTPWRIVWRTRTKLRTRSWETESDDLEDAGGSIGGRSAEQTKRTKNGKRRVGQGNSGRSRRVARKRRRGLSRRGQAAASDVNGDVPYAVTVTN